MHIRKLRLFDYKNYEEETLEFAPGINCLVGPNGSGKTNLVDAIYYLSLTKSAHTSRDKEVMRHGTTGFVLNGEWAIDEHIHQVNCGYRLGASKIIKWDGSEYERLSDHIGRIPLVLIAPNDTDVIRGTSEGRRRFFDIMLCQADPRYLHILMKYNHALKQRNALLKRFGQATDPELLLPFSQQLSDLGNEIYASRHALVEDFTADFESYYAAVAAADESAHIGYESHGSGDLMLGMEQSQEKDMILGRTTTGIHRDDYSFTLNERSIKKFGSQGQQKSLIVALKLAQLAYLRKRKKTEPVLLMDDIFDKLDMHRIEKLLTILREDGMGQVFITDAREARTRELLEQLNLDVKFFQVNQGKIHEIEK